MSLVSREGGYGGQRTGGGGGGGQRRTVAQLRELATSNLGSGTLLPLGQSLELAKGYYDDAEAAQDDLSGLEMKFVNYFRALSITLEVMPRHPDFAAYRTHREYQDFRDVIRREGMRKAEEAKDHLERLEKVNGVQAPADTLDGLLKEKALALGLKINHDPGEAASTTPPPKPISLQDRIRNLQQAGLAVDSSSSPGSAQRLQPTGPRPPPDSIRQFQLSPVSAQSKEVSAGSTIPTATSAPRSDATQARTPRTSSREVNLGSEDRKAFEANFPKVEDLDWPTAPAHLPGSMPKTKSELHINGSKPSSSRLAGSPEVPHATRPRTKTSSSSSAATVTPSMTLPKPALKTLALPKTNLVSASQLAAYLYSKSGPSVLILDLRPRDAFDRRHIKAANVVCIEPIILRHSHLRSSDIEAALCVGPKNAERLFARRRDFDLVVIVDETTTAWPPLSSLTASSSSLAMAGMHPPTEAQMLIGTLSRAIFELEFAKILQNPPLLLVGGMASWAQSIGESGIQPTAEHAGTKIRVNGRSKASPGSGTDVAEQLFSMSGASDTDWIETATGQTTKSISNLPPDQKRAALKDLHRKANITPDRQHIARAVSDLMMNNNTGASMQHDRPAEARHPLSQMSNGTAPLPPAFPPTPPTSFQSPLNASGFTSPSLTAPPPTLKRMGSDAYPGTSLTQSPQPALATHQVDGIRTPQAASPQTRHRSTFDDPFGGFNRSTPYPSLPAHPTFSRQTSGQPQLSTLTIDAHTPSGTSPRPSFSRARSPTLLPSPNTEHGKSLSYPSNFSQLGNVSIGSTGLKNLGNTCYMNSTLQCLSGVVPMARFFLDGSYRRFVNKINPLGSKGELAEAYAKLIRTMWSEQYTFVSPVSFKEAITRFAPQFRGTDQHDSQEFLGFLLDGLHEDLNVVRERPPPSELTEEREAELVKLPVQIAGEQEWQLYKSRNDSLIVDYFQGQFRNKLTCLTCGHSSITYNAFMYLSLPIPIVKGVNKVNLNQCVEAFVKEEILDKDDAWNCPQCKQRRKATKRLSISRLPMILLVHLKRFSYKGPFRDKLETMVLFPFRNFDLTNYMPPPLPPQMASAQYKMNGQVVPSSSARSTDLSPQRPPYVYDLFGVNNHFGSLTGGHYTASVRTHGQWQNFDDQRVSPCDESYVHSKAAYILWYVRKEVV